MKTRTYRADRGHWTTALVVFVATVALVVFIGKKAMTNTDPKYLRRLCRSIIGHSLTTTERVDVLQSLSECADEIQRLQRVELAARDYYAGYAQDEAEADGVEVTGCSEAQHLHAQRLRDALSIEMAQ